MKYLAWAFVTLGLLAVSPAPTNAQEDSQDRPVRLDRNYPNPFNPETTIPFFLDESLWESGNRPVVTLRIYNVLAQLVAVPVLLGSGEPMEDVALDWNGTGEYQAYWNGKVRQTNREAASGVYVYQLEVNGRRVGSMKMTVIK